MAMLEAQSIFAWDTKMVHVCCLYFHCLSVLRTTQDFHSINVLCTWKSTLERHMFHSLFHVDIWCCWFHLNRRLEKNGGGGGTKLPFHSYISMVEMIRLSSHLSIKTVWTFLAMMGWAFKELLTSKDFEQYFTKESHSPIFSVLSKFPFLRKNLTVDIFRNFRR